MDVKAALQRRATAAMARSARLLGRRAYNPGLLSIVVPAYNVEAYLGECLTSLREQLYGHFEIIVVDDSSPDGSRAVAESHAAQDKRVRVVTRPNGGLSAARNTGVEHAVGEFLTFVDADDRVDPGAYAPAIEALQESGSDFAVTFYRRLRRGLTDAPGKWIRSAHAERRLRRTLDDFPEIMVNAVAWSKVYRRRFYDEAELRFPEGVVYEDQQVSMRAFARAKSFDVLPNIGVEWRIRDDQTSISQQHAEVANIVAHTNAMKASIEELRSAGKERAAQIRALQLLDHNMQFFKLNAVHRDPAYWKELRDAMTFLVGQTEPEEYVAEVGAYKKVLNELINSDRMEDAALFQETVHPNLNRHPTRIIGDHVVVDFPLDLSGIPEESRRLSRTETGVRSRAHRLSWVGSHTLRVQGWAFLDNVHLGTDLPELEVVAVAADGTRVPLSVTQTDEPQADIASLLWHADVTRSGFVAELDTHLLPDTTQWWRLEAEVRYGELAGTGVVTCRPWVEAQIKRPLVDRPGRSVVIERNRAGRFFVNVATAPAYATRVGLEGDRLVVDGAGVLPDRVYLAGERRPSSPVVRAALQPAGGTWRAVLNLSGLPEGGDRELQVMATVGGVDHVLPDAADADDAPDAADAASEPALAHRMVERSEVGGIKLVQRRHVARIESVTVAEEEVWADVRLWGAEPDDWEAVLVSPGGEYGGTLEPGAEGTHRLRLPLTHDLWGRTGLVLPTELYQVALRVDGRLVVPGPSRALVAQLPHEDLHERLRTRLEVFEPRSPGVRVVLEPPLRDDERSLRDQQRLRVETRVPVADRPSVLFRTLYGEVANGNGLGVHEELRRRGSDLELCWSVQDYGVPTAEGARVLIEKTREWHEALNQSRYHMVDVHQLEWFHRPEGQSLVQTMHGYPYKVMGHEWWAKGGFPVQQVANFDRRAREWTHFVSPAAYATPLLRQAFLDPAGATCEVLEIGYPRNDVLLRPEGADVRRRTRDLLGLSDDQVVVMYGPTFRDYLSLDDMTAKRVKFFDPDAAVAALPDNFVVLMRGHAFNARMASERHESSDRVIDVTDYPDVNDLILASDAAVLDYSSLRFDYVLAGNPMVFLVPDLVEYDRARGGVIPYGPTAPGPQVRTTEQVVTWLRDLDRLREEYAGARETFRASYVEREDGHAAARLVDAVMGPRGDG